jgi:hypothetical protein
MMARSRVSFPRWSHNGRINLALTAIQDLQDKECQQKRDTESRTPCGAFEGLYRV